MLRTHHVPAAVLAAVALVCSSAWTPIAHAHAAAGVSATFDADAEPGSDAAPEADRLSDEAVEAFKARDYDTAIDKFKQAYEIDPQPNYKFNIGRVYEEKGDLENAVKYYQEFVQSPGVDLPSREQATSRLKVLKQALRELHEEEAKAREDEGKGTPATDAAADAPPPGDDAAKARKRKLRIAGYSLIGVGGVGLVIGSVFGGLALAKRKDANDEQFIENETSIRNEAKSRAEVAVGMLAAGGVLAGVGLILVLTTLGKKGNSTRTAAVGKWLPTPTFGRTGASLSWTARF